MSLVRTALAEEGGLLELTLAGPRGNVLTIDMMDELLGTLDGYRERDGLKLVLLQGSGGQFSYGASIEEHRRDRARELLGTFHRLVREVASYPVPVAALVEGRSLGAGFELALCCHFLFATPDASLAAPEIKLGVFPPVLAAVGSTRLGTMLAERLLLTGAALSGEEAREAGLLTAVVNGGEGTPRDQVVAWYRENLAGLSAYSLRQATRALRDASGVLEALGRPLDRAERLYLDALLASHDGNEGIEAFIAKRAPVWRNA